MELKVQQADIIAPLSRAADLVGGKSGAAFLRTFWFQKTGDSVVLFATDASIEFRADIPATATGGDFIIGLNGRKFYDLARRMSGELVITRGMEPDEEDNGGTLIISGSGGSFELPGTTANWFQDFKPWPESVPTIIWSGEYFLEIIDRVAWCCGDAVEDDFKANLCLRPAVNGRVEACALDGFNVASLRFINDDVRNILPKGGICIHRMQIATLKKWIPSDTIELAVTERRLFIRNADHGEAYSTPLTITDYPEIDSMLERFASKRYGTVAVQRGAMAHALDTIGLFLTRENRAALLAPGADGITLTTKDRKNKQAVRAECSGDAVEFPANAPTMSAALQHFNSEAVTLGLCYGNGKAFAMEITGDDDRDFRMVIMGLIVEEQVTYTEEEVEE